MDIVIAPDKFKGSLSAVRVAEALAAGVVRAFPFARVVLKPVADGGEGTVDALVASVGGRTVARRVTGPLGDPVEAAFGLLSDGRCVIEVAAACGITLMAPDRRDPLRTTSFGVGELVRAALEHDPARIIVGIGGTGSSDGGAGMAQALGWDLVDEGGRALAPGGGALSALAHIDRSGAAPIPVDVVAGHDVTNPLLGGRGAARVFGPQKGASPEQVEVLEAGLTRLAERIEVDVGVRVADLPGAGAGGGLGAGVVAFLGGRLEPALDLVIDAVGLDDALADADLVITGEGRLDDQSLAGKTPVGVARRSRAAGVECVVVAGEVALYDDELAAAGFAHALSLIDTVGRSASFEDPEGALAATAARLTSIYL